jgi:hypothetical protein
MKKHAEKKESKKLVKPGKGDKYVCGMCGMSVIVDEECGCVDECDIICCGTQMAANKKIGFMK